MEHTDVCFAPVLTMSEAYDAPAQPGPRHVRRDRRRPPAGAGPAVQPHAGRDLPRRRRTPASTRKEVLADWGVAADRIDALVESGAVKDAGPA